MFQIWTPQAGYSTPRDGIHQVPYSHLAEKIKVETYLAEERLGRDLAKSMLSSDSLNQELRDREIFKSTLGQGLRTGVKGLTDSFYKLSKIKHHPYLREMAGLAFKDLSESHPVRSSQLNYQLETNLFEEAFKLGLTSAAFKRLGEYVSHLNTVHNREDSSPVFRDLPAKALHPITPHVYFAGDAMQNLVLDLFKSLIKIDIPVSLFSKPLDSQAYIIDRDLKMTASLFKSFNESSPQYLEAKNLVKQKLTNLFEQGARHGISAQALLIISSASNLLIPGTQKAVELVDPEFLHTQIKTAIDAYLKKSEIDQNFCNKINHPSQCLNEQNALAELIEKKHYGLSTLKTIYPELQDWVTVNKAREVFKQLIQA